MRRCLSILVLALGLSNLPLTAGKPVLPWEHGTLMDVSSGKILKKKQKRFVTRMYTWEFKIDDGSAVIRAQYRGPKALVVDKGSVISFAITGDTLYLRDSGGQPHKLEVVGKTAK
jgi:hypothetical protein